MAFMTIGDFSRATQLSAKTLRYYHQAEILEPASIDPTNGYRRYTTEQISDAQVIRQLRALSVPVDTVRAIVTASDIATRNELISSHLTRLEAELDATRAAVRSLRVLLDPAPTPIPVEFRSLPPTRVLGISQTIDLADLPHWYNSTLEELDQYVQSEPGLVIGSRGGLWSTDLFVHERGMGTLFYPLDGAYAPTRPPAGRIHALALPAVDLAVAVHRGPDETMAQTYGALGAYVAQHEIGVDGPLRENYLVNASDGSTDVVTEVGWPIFRTAR